MNGEQKVLKFKPPVWGLVLASVVTFFLVIFLAALTWNAIKQHDYIGRSDQQIYTIAISGEGKVTAVPDIAQVSLGIETQSPSVATAQKENTDKMNKLITELKSLDIDKEDIKTVNYNIYPQYDWLDGRQILRGYSVSQSATVKIRDLEKISAVLEKSVLAGANQVGGLTFTIDEPEALRQQAREKALLNAKEKAESLAKIAGVKLGRLVSFNEFSNGYPPVYYGDYALKEQGIGGGAAPQIELGSQEIIINVNVTYEVL